MALHLRQLRLGFNRIELAVVAFFLLVFAGIVLWGVQLARRTHQLTVCKDNLRAIAIACHDANDQHGFLPPALGWYPPPEGKGSKARSFGNVFFHLLPYIGEDELFKGTATKSKAGIRYVPWKNEAAFTPVRSYLCPANPSADGDGMTDVGWAAGCYAYNGRVFAVINNKGLVVDWSGKPQIPRTFQSGTSNTILLTEKYPRCCDYGNLWAEWKKNLWQPGFALWNFHPEAKFLVRPDPFLGDACDPTRASTPHAGGIHIARADAGVTFIKQDFESGIWWQACFPGWPDWPSHPPGRDEWE